MDIKTRVRNILLTPNTEWPVIADEPAPIGTIVTGYVMPLAAIGAIAGFIGGSLVGLSVPFLGRYRVPITTGLAGAALTFGFAIVGVFILAFIINALAPTFGAQKDSNKAFKVAVYSYTPAWVAGVLQIVPALGFLGVLAGLYGLYLLYLGLPALMKCPLDKAVGYTAVVVVCAIVLSIILMSIGGLVVAPAALSMASASSSSSANTQFPADSPLGQLEAIGRKLEESGAKMEQAEKRGDAAGQTAAAFEGLGALLGGGKRVDPVGLDQLKPLVPEQFAGLARRSSNAERNGVAGIMVAKAEASYGDGAGQSATLEITDAGGATGMLGLASWANLQGERENDQVSERTERIGGRLVHQRMSKTGGTHEYNLIIGDRFIVTAKGNGIEFAALRTAVSNLDLQKLEAMKNVGVVK
ncbi:MAG TPA: Yip1 family protein [Vicinamibacterales bacterium]|nr:Yip1 family protein [Vicinamibacterales bacterium]